MNKNNKELKQEVLINAGDIYNELYDLYKNKYNKEINSLNTKNRKNFDYKKLRLSDDYQYSSEEEQEETKTDMNEITKYIAEEETDINEALFKRHFNFQRPSNIFNSLNNINDIKQKNKLINVIISGLKVMFEEERETEKPDKIVEIVEEILRFNKQKQEGQGIKTLAPDEMLNRLPISLAQLQAGNNSEKMKNEIRQLLYSLYCSKNINNLIKPL